MTKWLTDHVSLKVSRKTHERYSEIANNHIVPALGEIRLQQLQPVDIEGFYADALRKGRRIGEGGLSKRSVLHIHRILRQALKQAVRWKLLVHNPTDAVEPPKADRKEIVALTELETAMLLTAAGGTSFYIPALLAVTTGLRRGEILALRWSDVDLERGTLAVRRTLEQTKARLAFKAPKTQMSRRTVALPVMTVDALRKHKVGQAQDRLRLGLGRDDDGLVCARFDGEPRSPHAFTSEFTRFVAKLDISRITFHGLRHSHASHLLRAGVHPKVTQERLGHSTISTTMDLYSHVLEGMQEDAASRIDTALRTALGQQNGNSEVEDPA
jgi:integrase